MKKKPEWYEGFIQFKVGKKKVEFTIIHNIHGRGNVNSIDAALDNWLVRTDEYTPESFVDYINSKDIYEAYTINQFKEKLLNENPSYRPSATSK